MHAYVVSTERLTPTMVRVVLAGGDLDGFAMVDATDAYVNLAFAPEGASYDGSFEPAQVRDALPRHEWPARRRYTVRRWDPAARRLTIDFVVHGDDGIAGSWARSATPGAVLVLEGPSGGYRPDPAADWHLLAGDESALPAIAASVESLPADALAVVRMVCDGPEHELPLDSAATLDLEWLHRTGEPEDAELLVRAVESVPFPRGSVHAFVHGEAGFVRELRRFLRTECAVPRERLSASGYWRLGRTDEGWRAEKAAWNAAVEADESKDPVLLTPRSLGASLGTGPGDR
jgi:NADPH-dependent ferric siderophore reductase